MKNKLSALWAATPSSNRREPTGSEIATGFPCGPADQQLFNELIYRLSQINAEIDNAVSLAGLTPDEAVLTQLWQAILRAGRGTPVVFSTPGATAWTVPDGVTKIYVRVWGAGGGGGGSSTAANSIASSGAGGGYSEGVETVTPGQVITVTVGAGGTGGAAGLGSNPGAAGGTSSVGALISATGGGGGFSADGAIQVSTASAGTGVGGALNLTGTGGGIGYSTGGGFALASGGATFGSNYTPVKTTGTLLAGAAGQFPGGGASGGALGGAGGGGAHGLIIIQY